MIRIQLCCAVLLSALTASASGQSISGDWQASIHGKRIVVHITDHGANDFTGMMFNADRPPDGFGISAFDFHAPSLSFSVEALHFRFAGNLGPGDTLRGTWFDGQPSQVEFQHATLQTAWRKPPPAKITFIETAPGVRLETVDWGGSGRPLLLIAGLGNTAHIFDAFAPKLTPRYHVYGVTRRGFGESSVPAPLLENYTADALADDDLSVAAKLKLDRPVFAAHSLGGEELSSIASRHPGTAAGLIYLEAGYSQSLYDPADHDIAIHAGEAQRLLNQLSVPGGSDSQRKHVVRELESSLAALQDDVRGLDGKLRSAPDLSPGQSEAWAAPLPWSAAAQACMQGMEKYTAVSGPILAFFAGPHKMAPDSSAEAKAEDARLTTEHANLFRSMPGATIVTIPDAGHYIFLTDEAQVIQSIDAWVAALK